MQCLKRAVPWGLQYDSIIRRLQSSDATSKIRIPERIERGPTDILVALESTLQKQTTVPHYKFIDDPYLLPITKSHYRSYPMAREAGKKAAMWVYQNHSDLFEKNRADPSIPIFEPYKTYTDASQVSEETLKSLIKDGKLNSAIEVYNLLERKVSDETKQSLLEIICFLNGQEEPSEKLYEEQWIIKDNARAISNTWNDIPIAREIFHELIKKGPELQSAAYSAYISGMAKYFNISKAWELFKTCEEEQIPLSLNAYNYLLPTIPIHTKVDALRRTNIIYIFKLMSQRGVRPDVNTLNGALSATIKMLSPECQRFALLLFTEFKRIGIQPCLTSYYLALLIFGKHDKSLIPLLNNILDNLEESDIEIKNVNDTLFFAAAMNIAAEEYNTDTVNKVHALYLRKDNYKFINKSYQESLYYRYYMLAQLNLVDLTQFFKLYQEIVPNVYIPETDVMEQILQTIEMCSVDLLQEYLTVLWPDIIKFHFVERSHLLLKVLQMTEKVMNYLDSSQRTEFASHALAAWKQLMEMNAKQFERLVISVKIVGTVAVIFAKAELLEESWNIVTFLVKNMNVLVDTTPTEQINELYDFYISKEFSQGAMLLIQYLMNMECSEALEKAKLLNQQLTLSKSQKEQLFDMFGSEMFEDLEELQSCETSRDARL